MFDMLKNPAGMFKILQAAGVQIKFDCEKKAMIIKTDDSEQVHTFEQIEKMVNG